MQTEYFQGKDGYIWWHGVVEDRKDPLFLGRCRVRILGWHTENKAELPTDMLPWAQVLMPITSASQTGVGQSPVGPVEGTWVMGYYRDGELAQEPVMMGTMHGIPAEFAKQNNRTPIFWDDMYLKHGGVWMVTRNTKLTKEKVDSIWIDKEERLTEYLDDFPKNCIYMRWNYFSPWAEGNLKTIDWYKENNLKVMGATAGQTRWVLMPQDYSNIESIKSFALTSVEKELDGLLLTLWDDDSPHFELYKRGI